MESKFIQSPFFNNWFCLSDNRPNNSLLICSPYFKKYALDKIINLYDLSKEDSNIKTEILIRGKLEDFIHGSSDISALESLLRLKNADVTKIRRVTNLHMKGYLIDNEKLLIGSGNCTSNGLFARNNSGNVEGAISTSDKSIIDGFNTYYSSILKNSEQLDIFYNAIVKQYNEYIENNPPANNITNAISSAIKKNESKSRHIFSTEYQYTSKPPILVGLVTKESAIKSFNENAIRNDIGTSAIPQYSNFDNGAYKVVEILHDQGNSGLTFTEMGSYLEGQGKKNIAYYKYGENHAKLAELLDFVTITNTRPRKVFLTKFGEAFYNSKQSKKIEIIKNQIFRMDLVKYIIQKHAEDSFNLEAYLLLYLKPSTVNRRKSNIKTLFKFLRDNGVDDIDIILKKLG